MEAGRIIVSGDRCGVVQGQEGVGELVGQPLGSGHPGQLQVRLELQRFGECAHMDVVPEGRKIAMPILFY